MTDGIQVVKTVHGHKEGGVCKHKILTRETLKIYPGTLRVYVYDSTSSFIVSAALIIDCTYADFRWCASRTTPT